MLDFLIVLNSGAEFLSRGWADRPMQDMLLTLHRLFPDVRELVLIGFRP